MVLEQTRVTLDENIELLREIFAAKEVETRLLGLLPTTREFHRTEWEKVVLSAPGAGSFDQHFEYVVGKTATLKTLWVEEAPTR
jgi:hypothetical protein